MNVAAVVPAFASVTDASLILRSGSGSSSTIVPTPVASAMVALVGFVRFRLNVSLPSLRHRR